MLLVRVPNVQDVPEGGAACWTKQWVELSSKVDTMSTIVQRSVTETGINKHADDATAKLLFSIEKGIYEYFLNIPPLVVTSCVQYQNTGRTTFLYFRHQNGLGSRIK